MTKDTPALGRVPALLLAPAALALMLLVLPAVGLLSRTPWAQFPSRIGDPALADALRLSLVTATASMLIAIVLGVPLAWILARVDFWGKRLVRALVIVPMILPPVVGGVALLMAFGRRGLLGGPLFSQLGITIPFSTLAVVIAQTFVALPFLVISVEGALRTSDSRFDEVAATLGASRWRTFLRVSVPLAGPGVASGAALAWARALGEFGATITFAGNAPGVTRTMPLQIYTALQADADAAILLSVVLLAISIAVLLLLRERWIGGGFR